MDGKTIEQVRNAAGISQGDLANHIGTSRPTLSAYENNRKSPTLKTVQRILDATNFSLVAIPKIHFTEVIAPRGRPFFVPSALWSLPLEQAFATVTLPLELNWSSPQTKFDLSQRHQRRWCYEIVVREGMPEHIQAYIDGALVIDLWNELVIPTYVRNTWQHLIEKVLPSTDLQNSKEN